MKHKFPPNKKNFPLWMGDTKEEVKVRNNQILKKSEMQKKEWFEKGFVYESLSESESESD